MITKDVAPDALAVARGRQMEKAGWAVAFRAAQAAKKGEEVAIIADAAKLRAANHS